MTAVVGESDTYVRMQHRTLHLFIWLAILLLFAGVISGVGYFYFGNSKPEGNQIALYPAISEVAEAKLDSDKSVAIAKYEEIINNPSSSADEKALAEVVMAGVKFSATGDMSARIEEIRSLKKSFLDPTVIRGTRAAALSILGREYSLSGRNPDVLREVYKDPPFNQYFVRGDPDRSAILMEMASYEIYPSTVAAISIAQTAAGIEFAKKSATAGTPANIALAEEYLKKADAAAVQDSMDNPSYVLSDRYFSYIAGRAYTIGRLAIVKGEPYKSSYRSEFDTLINKIYATPRPLPDELMLNVRFTYARILGADADTESQKVQLDEIARILNGLSDPERYSFVLLLRNEQRYRPDGYLWSVVKRLSGVSPDFRDAVAKVAPALVQ